MENTPATATVLTTALCRQRLGDWLATQLGTHGYRVTGVGTNALDVHLNDVYLGDLNLHRIHYTNRLHGEVQFDPSASKGGSYDGKGSYRLQGDDTINLSSLFRRLRQVYPLALAQRAANAKRKAREASDKALEEALGLDTLADNVEVSVWDSKVEVKLTDLTPDQAAQVLALARTFTTEGQ